MSIIIGFLLSILIVNIVFGCDCRYWSDYTYGYPLDMCTYNNNNNAYTAVFTECYTNSTLGGYILKQTSYAGSQSCNGGNGVSMYYSESDGYHYNCESNNTCDYAVQYISNNNKYMENSCGNSDNVVISKEYKVLGCCIETNNASYYSSCMSDIITTDKYNDGILSCYNGLPTLSITGYTDGADGIRIAKLVSNGTGLSPIKGPFTVGAALSALVANPAKNRIYIASEIYSGIVTTIVYDNEYNKINQYTNTSHGRNPTFISRNGNYVYVANIGSGEVDSSGLVVYTLDDNGDIMNSAYISFPEANGRCHSVLSHPNNPRQIYIADLNRNVVEHYYYNPISNNITFKSSVDLGTGAGPRTIAFNPKVDGVLYVSRETDNKVSVIWFDIDTYMLSSVTQTLSTLTAPVNGSQFVGHCVTDKMGKYLYVANRVTVNSMAIFQINPDGSLVDNSLFEIYSGGFVPRYMDVDPTNKYLIVGNMGAWGQNRGNLTIFEIDHDNNGSLTQLSNHVYTLLAPSWVDFLTNFDVIKTPNTNNACYDDNNMLTNTYTTVYCDEPPSTSANMTSTSANMTSTSANMTTTIDVLTSNAFNCNIIPCIPCLIWILYIIIQ